MNCVSAGVIAAIVVFCSILALFCSILLGTTTICLRQGKTFPLIKLIITMCFCFSIVQVVVQLPKMESNVKVECKY